MRACYTIGAAVFYSYRRALCCNAKCRVQLGLSELLNARSHPIRRQNHFITGEGFCCCTGHGMPSRLWPWKGKVESMPTRYLKPGIRDSEHIDLLSDCPDAECLYYRLLVTVDDFGRFDGRPLFIKAQCFPVRLRATVDKCMQWLKKLQDCDLIQLYTIDNKEYLQIRRWDNKPRSEASKYPDPPPVADKCIQLYTNVNLTVTETVTETVNRNIITPSVMDAGFEQFWTAYPRKVGKGAAEKAWAKVRPDSELLAAILAAVETAKVSLDWRKDGGQFIPHPATWLNGKRWLDDLAKETINGEQRSRQVAL